MAINVAAAVCFFFVLTCDDEPSRSLLYYTERTLHYKVHGMMIMMMTMMYTR